MKTIKEVTIRIMAENGEVKEGSTVVFNAGGNVLTGVFNGINKKGNYEFVGTENFEDVKFTVAPRAIDKMYLAEVTING